MYVPVKGGAGAIAASISALDQQRRGDLAIPEVEIDQIIAQFSIGLDRIMSEAGLYDPRLAAIAFKQAQGDIAEAVFLLRAHRAQLTDFGEEIFVALGEQKMERDISATTKELSQGQILGATYDYSHRLLDFTLETGRAPAALAEPSPVAPSDCAFPDLSGFMHVERDEPVDITRKPLSNSPKAAERLGHLARGEEGYMTGLAYGDLRKAGQSHPYVHRLQRGQAALQLDIEDIGLTVQIGDLPLTTCVLIEAKGDELVEGFGIAFGAAERRALAMAAMDHRLKQAPVSSDEIMQCDGVAGYGYLSHLKLPHYSDFAADLALLSRLRQKSEAVEE